MFLLLIHLLFTQLSFSQSFRLDLDTPPKIELGAGIGWVNLPYYPGAKERRNIVLPFPAFIYRGDILRADEDGGMRGRFFSSERFEINASFGLTLPVDNEDVAVRSQMNELDPLLEVGPGLIYHIIPRQKNKKFSLSLNLAPRLAFSTDFKSAKEQGYALNPLFYSWYQFSKRLTLFSGLSGLWATKEYQEYFYEVPSQYATATRPSYQAQAGNISYNLSQFLIFNPSTSFSVVVGGIYENYHWAANKESPLHQKDENFSTILAFTWWFYQK